MRGALWAAAAGLTLAALGGAGPALAASRLTPILTYTSDPFAVFGGDREDAATYAHQVVAGFNYTLSPKWTLTAQGGWTAGASLSEQAVGDIAGVQGVFNNGDQVWLYQLQATGTFKQGQVSFGRLSAGDAFGALPVMNQFANSAFSSNGGAISVNDAGRATSPASSWGATGQWSATAALTLKGGAFLSDPTLFSDGFKFSTLAFKPGRGVLGFAEADIALGKAWSLALGGYADSGRTTTFAGRSVRGNSGYYASLDGALIPGKKASDPARLEGFVMLQAAPRDDRSLQPFFVIGGLVLTGTFPKREKDVLAFGLQSGRISRKTGGGTETAIELNYRWTLNDRWGLRPDLQYVIGPSGRDSDAFVLGVQVEFSL